MTERQISLWMTPEGEEEPMRRSASSASWCPEDIARVVLFLSSDEASRLHQPELRRRRRLGVSRRRRRRPAGGFRWRLTRPVRQWGRTTRRPPAGCGRTIKDPRQ